MLRAIPTTPKRLEEYRPIAGDECIDEIQQLAGAVRGARVLHLNATAFGGGVAELLTAMVPLLQDVGVSAEWQVIQGAEEFYAVTKALHNALQGMLMPWTPQMKDVWLRYNHLNAELFDEAFDFVVVHDPQPAAILATLTERLGRRPAGRWIWRCHIDTTDAQPEIWDLFRPTIEPYDAAIFSVADYLKEDVNQPRLYVIPPAIDPLSPKNVELSSEASQAILRRYQVDPERPIMLQVSRFDPWKDPLGVIEVYRGVKPNVPGLQLVLIASMAHDDPEGWAWYERTVRRAGEDFDIHILTNLTGVGNVEVNAFQRCADVIVQKSLREGFGLVVAEGLWKRRPVVAGFAGGIPLQVLYGRTGFLANTTAEYINRVQYLLQNPSVADRMGAIGRDHVRQQFLITRYLRDYLAAFADLQSTTPADQQSVAGAPRAGMRLATGARR